MSASGAATRTLLCLLAFSAPLPGQPADRESARPAAIPTPEKNKLAALLPAPPEFFGKPGAPAKFYSTDLYHYLDGGADAYLDYGLVALIHREFKAGSVDLTVDIYDMGDPLRAFGIYSAERSPVPRRKAVWAAGPGGGGCRSALVLCGGPVGHRVTEVYPGE
jgi:hypothetical protein